MIAKSTVKEMFYCTNYVLKNPPASGSRNKFYYFIIPLENSHFRPFWLVGFCRNLSGKFTKYRQRPLLRPLGRR